MYIPGEFDVEVVGFLDDEAGVEVVDFLVDEAEPSTSGMQNMPQIVPRAVPRVARTWKIDCRRELNAVRSGVTMRTGHFHR